jgi:dipeptide/tripeptide permease
MIITSGIARSVWLIKTQKDREIRVFAVLALSAILMSATFCYVDLGLTSARVPIILGLAIGTLGVLDRLRDDSKSRLIEG